MHPPFVSILGTAGGGSSTDILSIASSHQAKPIVCTVASIMRDFAPLASIGSTNAAFAKGIELQQEAKLDEAAIIAAIDAAVAETGAASPADIGKLMGVLKPKLAGQADMGLVSKLVKQRLSA